MDTGIGRILTALEKRRLSDNTLVIFSYDHGGRDWARSAPFTGAFATLREGGIRVPVLMRWPARLPAGDVFRQPTISMDLTATILAAADALAADPGLDGVNLLPALSENTILPARDLFWRGDYNGSQWAVRSGRWKYLRVDATERLFDVALDPAESHDLAQAHPVVLKSLRDKLANWEADLR